MWEVGTGVESTTPAQHQDLALTRPTHAIISISPKKKRGASGGAKGKGKAGGAKSATAASSDAPASSAPSFQDWGALPAPMLSCLDVRLFNCAPIADRPVSNANAAGQPAPHQNGQAHPAAATRGVNKAWHATAKLTALLKWTPLAQALAGPPAELQDIAESVEHLYVTVPAGELVGGSLAAVQERLEGRLREHWPALTTVTWQVLDVVGKLTWAISQGMAWWKAEQPQGFHSSCLPGCPNMLLTSPMVLDSVVLNERSLAVSVGDMYNCMLTVEFEGPLTWRQLIAGVFAAGNKPASAERVAGNLCVTGQPRQGPQPVTIWDSSGMDGIGTMWFACLWSAGPPGSGKYKVVFEIPHQLHQWRDGTSCNDGAALVMALVLALALGARKQEFLQQEQELDEKMAAPPMPDRVDTAAGADAIAQLVRMLRPGSSAEVQRAAVVALQVLALPGTSAITQIGKAGAIPLLVDLLDAGAPPVMQQHATELLGNLAKHKPNGAAMKAAGAIPALMRVLGHGSAPDLRRDAAGALSDLAGAMNVAQLMQLLEPLYPTVLKERTVRKLDELCLHNERNCGAIAEAGAVPQLVRLLGPGFSTTLQCDSCLLLVHLKLWAGQLDPIADAGAITPLVHMLGPESSTAEHICSSLLLTMLTANGTNTKNVDAIVSAGARTPLVRLIAFNTAPTLEQESAAGMLWHLTSPTGDAARGRRLAAAVSAAGGIPPLARLLGPESGAELQVTANATLDRLLVAVSQMKQHQHLVELLAPALPPQLHVKVALHLEAVAAALASLKLNDAAVVAGAKHAIKLLNAHGTPATQPGDAAGALCLLAATATVGDAVAIVKAGALPALARMMHADQPGRVRRFANDAVKALCDWHDVEDASLVAAAGAASVKPLKQLLAFDDSHSSRVVTLMQRAAASALEFLKFDDGIRDAVAGWEWGASGMPTVREVFDLLDTEEFSDESTYNLFFVLFPEWFEESSSDDASG
ncbi:hypothetical protein FOA52_014249 [Chlamydomonas sp. UWO 241]|nr:hypothetical protein FOA52_014249 [Chlamydomonas sp. UWO 241]